MTMGMLAIGMMGAVAGTPEQQQLTACRDAQIAIARNSPAAPGLMDLCGGYRSVNVAAGRLLVDALPPDPALRVQFTDIGNRIIQTDPTGLLHAAAGPLDADPEVRRGFAIGVRTGAGMTVPGSSPGYPAYMRASLSPKNAQGFDIGLKAVQAAIAAGTQKAGGGGGSSEILGLPIPVAIGIGAGILGVIAVVAYKLTR